MDLEKLKRALFPLPIGGLRSFESIASTNDEALSWLEEGCADTSLVIADEQTKGRGRFDRVWVTRPGTSLAFSLAILPTDAEKQNLQLFAPMCGLAVQEALQDLYKVNAQIKWPNDILIDRSKCAGILVEAAWLGDELKGAVLGIGINIAAGSVPPPSDQLFPATCVEAAAGRMIDRFEVLRAVLNSAIEWRQKLGSAEFFSAWQSHLAFLGEWVKIVQTAKPPIIGIVKGIDSRGRLIVVGEDNLETAIEVGDVHLRLADKPML